MPKNLKTKTTTRSKKRGGPVARRPTHNGPPPHPGEILREEFLVPLGITQFDLAVRLGVSFPRLNDLVLCKRGVTINTALRLARVVGKSADYWLTLQKDWDLWHAMRSDKAAEINHLKPLRRIK